MTLVLGVPEEPEGSRNERDDGQPKERCRVLHGLELRVVRQKPAVSVSLEHAEDLAEQQDHAAADLLRHWVRRLRRGFEGDLPPAS